MSIGRVVFDCNVYAQRLLNPGGPAGKCVDLAMAQIIVSRDKHLLGLNNPALDWSGDFRARFPGLRILPPQQFLSEFEAERRRLRDQGSAT
jgi:predicted nucleic acid-binding protein